MSYTINRDVSQVILDNINVIIRSTSMDCHVQVDVDEINNVTTLPITKLPFIQCRLNHIDHREILLQLLYDIPTDMQHTPLCILSLSVG